MIVSCTAVRLTEQSPKHGRGRGGLIFVCDVRRRRKKMYRYGFCKNVIRVSMIYCRVVNQKVPPKTSAASDRKGIHE